MPLSKLVPNENRKNSFSHPRIIFNVLDGMFVYEMQHRDTNGTILNYSPPPT